jgi:hypothetical protein
MNKKTRREYRKFREEFLKMQRKLNLMDWRIYFELKKLKRGYAEIAYNVDIRVATIRMTTMIDEDFNPVRAARHEAIHLLMARLSNFARCRFISEYEINEENERLAMLLENLL